MPLHKNLTPPDIHIIFAWSYADETERLAATGFTASDVGKVAQQQSDDSYWILTNHSPIAWSGIAGSGITDLNAIHKNVSAEISTIAEKVAPVSADLLVVEDSESANAKKRLRVGNLPNKPPLSNTPPVNVTKAAASAGTAAEASKQDHKHDVSTAAPGTTGVATASGEGSATTVARSDHTHQSNTAPANVTKAAAAIGTSGEPARADHKHDISTAVPVSVGTANAEGTATSVARSDHIHSGLKRDAGDFAVFTEKAAPVSADVLLLEDSAAAGAKKKVQIGNLPTGSDPNAIHKNVAAEFSTITEKTAPVATDLLLIEDSAAANAKKRLQVGNLLVLSSLAAVQARRTTNFTIPAAYSNVTLDTTDVQTKSSVLEHSAAFRDRILVKETGTYRVTFTSSVLFSNGATSANTKIWSRVRKNDATVLNGSEVHAGNHYSGSGLFGEDPLIGNSFLVGLTAGDYLSLQMYYSDEAQTGLVATGTILTVVKMDGITGPQGPAGSGSSLTIKDEGGNVPNTPHTALNFVGDGVTATDAGGGVAQVSVLGVKSDFAEIAVDTTTTSGTYVDLLSLAITKQRAGSALLIFVSVSASVNSNDRYIRIQLLIDGVAKRGFAIESTNAEGNTGALVYKATGIGAGARTIKIQWQVEGGQTASIRPVSTDYEHASILVEEVTV